MAGVEGSGVETTADGRCDLPGAESGGQGCVNEEVVDGCAVEVAGGHQLAEGEGGPVQVGAARVREVEVASAATGADGQRGWECSVGDEQAGEAFFSTMVWIDV